MKINYCTFEDESDIKDYIQIYKKSCKHVQKTDKNARINGDATYGGASRPLACSTTCTFVVEFVFIDLKFENKLMIVRWLNRNLMVMRWLQNYVIFELW